MLTCSADWPTSSMLDTCQLRLLSFLEGRLTRNDLPIAALVTRPRNIAAGGLLPVVRTQCPEWDRSGACFIADYVTEWKSSQGRPLAAYLRVLNRSYRRSYPAVRDFVFLPSSLSISMYGSGTSAITVPVGAAQSNREELPPRLLKARVLRIKYVRASMHKRAPCGALALLLMIISENRLCMQAL